MTTLVRRYNYQNCFCLSSGSGSVLKEKSRALFKSFAVQESSMEVTKVVSLIKKNDGRSTKLIQPPGPSCSKHR